MENERAHHDARVDHNRAEALIPGSSQPSVPDGQEQQCGDGGGRCRQHLPPRLAEHQSKARYDQSYYHEKEQNHDEPTPAKGQGEPGEPGVSPSLQG
ncbi:MAG: hypothetical protein IH629_03920 [Thermoleophilia bacterium]|nr:hypothetical protein [Thermoleophilia bacterium]